MSGGRAARGGHPLGSPLRRSYSRQRLDRLPITPRQRELLRPSPTLDHPLRTEGIVASAELFREDQPHRQPLRRVSTECSRPVSRDTGFQGLGMSRIDGTVRAQEHVNTEGQHATKRRSSGGAS